MRKYFFIALSLLLLSFLQLSAQSPKIAVSLKPEKIKIGEQASFLLSVDYRGDQGNIEIDWPRLEDRLGEVAEILEKTKVDTLIPDKEKDDMLFQMKQTLTLTVFDPGLHLLPPVPFVINGDTVYSEALFLDVKTVPVDTSKAFRDIKEIYELPKTFAEWFSDNWPWLAGLLAAILIAGGLWYYRSKQDKPEAIKKDAAPKILPHVEALLKYSDLERRKLWQSGEIKNYYSELTDITRHYIERRFSVPAMEQTTNEIVSNLRYAGLDEGGIERLKRLLVRADIVKFAKGNPIGQDNELAIADAREFVNHTKQVAESKEEGGLDV